jgi:glycine dehydrogenase subunit 1
MTDIAHPYIPNSAPEARRKALDAIGVDDVEELYAAIPERLRMREPLELPEAIRSEQGLRRHVERILSSNRGTQGYLSFLGGGCWEHYVPAVCDEINSRGEFLTAYGGLHYSDHGKYQALFEFQSMMGELVGMDVVSAPTYDWAGAAASALLMACRVTGRSKVVVPGAISADKLAQIRNFARPAATVETVRYDRTTGALDLDDLRSKVDSETAAVYIENPSYLGLIEGGAAAIADIAHEAGALSIVGVDPSSLGVLAPPSDYGADIVCGEIQPLGMHMHAGGGLGGFIASRDDERLVAEYPTYLVSLGAPEEGGGWGFGVSTFERTSYEKRESSPDYYGTTQWLWGITAAVYLSLMGPRGMEELGEGLMQRSLYTMRLLDSIDGVTCPVLTAASMKEFAVNFDGTGKTIEEINAALLDRGILGGQDLSKELPELGQSALYCVTEVHTKDDLHTLADALREVLS